MRGNSAAVLFIVGATLLVVPIVSRAYVQSVVANRDKERVAEFYQRYTNNTMLPKQLHPTEFNYSRYDHVCMVVGVGLIGLGVVMVVGVVQPRPRVTGPDAEPGAAPDPGRM